MVASGLIGAFVASQGWVVCAAILVVMVMGTVWPWLAMRGLDAEIEFDRRRCHELDEVTVQLTVVNRWPWPVWGLLVQRGFFHATEQDHGEAATALARVGAWSKTYFEFTYRPNIRGVYPLEEPVLATGFPFGIWIATKGFSVAESLIVWPRCVPLKSLPAMAGDRLAAAGSFVDRAGHDGDVLAARPYVQGDSPRRIHWIHTARRDSLIVCDRQTASRRSVLIVLDRNAFKNHANEDQSACNWSLRAVATLCREFHRHSYDVTCELNGERIVVASSVVGLHRLFDRLAAFSPVTTSFEQRIEPPRTYGSDQLAIWVTSGVNWREVRTGLNGSWRRSGIRAMVLDSNSEHEAAEFESPQPWVCLDLADEPSRQLQQQWERRCHDDWAQ